MAQVVKAIIAGLIGVWRSLVAHLHGVQGVEGSNPFTPTIKTSIKAVWYAYLAAFLSPQFLPAGAIFSFAFW